MKTVYIIQPILTDYRIQVYRELSHLCHLTIIYSPTPNNSQGFGDLSQIANNKTIRWIQIPTLCPFGEKLGMYQCGIINSLRKNRPDKVILFSNLRYFSFWTTLIWCRLNKIPIFLHGHGVYKKKQLGLLWKIIYKIIFKLSSGYICYTPLVADSLLNLGLPKQKIVVAENSLDNPFPVLPAEKKGDENGILFIGRLRFGCGMDNLIKATARMRQQGYPDIVLHIIGGGEKLTEFQKYYGRETWIIFYGECYDAKRIAEISRQCRVGCYPGNAGLSVVHMFSLSLPPITHNDMKNHQGPEPSYIVSGENGLLFEQENPEQGIMDALKEIFDNPQKLKHLQTNAYKTYEMLTQPSLAMRMFNIINDNDN